jgi:hypothetical protein
MLAQRVRVGIKAQKKARKSVASTHQFVRSDLPCLLPHSSVISYGRRQVSFTKRARSWIQSASLTPPG